MSVIFQALQKLEPDRGDAAAQADGFERPTPMVNPGRRLLPRFTKLAVFTALVVGLGFGAVHGVRWLGAGAPRPPETPSKPVRHAMPRATAKVSVQAAGPGPAETSPEPARARYYPPESAGNIPAAAATGPEEDLSRAVPKDGAGQTGLPPGPTAENRPDAKAPQLEKEPVAPAEATARGLDNPSEESPPALQGDHMDPAWLAAEAARVAAIEQNARIGRLVRRIEVSLQAPGHEPGNPADEGETEGLLRELARLKGEDSAYVNKLRAYWWMKTGQYEKAEPVLHRILAVNPHDLEAGLNLAVVLINTGRLGQAGQRLRQLREVYPGNGAVADLLRRVKR